MKGVKPTPRPASHRRNLVAQRRRNIQAIDLSHSGDQNEYAQHGPHEYRKLHRLHTDVNKGFSVPIIGAKLSYAARSQPQISFLNHSVSSSNPNSKPSSGYDDGWMDDFPSPSSLLDNSRSNSKRLLETKNFQAADKAALGGDSASSHANHQDDDDPAITLADEKCKKTDLNARCYEIYQGGISTPPLPKLPRVAFEQWQGIESISSDNRLFCSVDSPQQATSPLEKRKLAAGPELLRPGEKLDVKRRSRTDSPQVLGSSLENDSHWAKKRRVSDPSNEQVVLVSIDGVSQSQPS